jgi:hypothetical protein
MVECLFCCTDGVIRPDHLTYIAAALAHMPPLFVPIWLYDVHLCATHATELALKLWPDETLYGKLRVGSCWLVPIATGAGAGIQVSNNSRGLLAA